MHILLVEDEQNFGAVMRDYLEMNQYAVTWCKDGQAGWKTYQEGVFGLCILDVMMPKKDGFSLAQDIRKHTPQQPLLFVTARAQKEDIIKGFKLGADDYIVKPFDPEELLYRIKAILNRSAQQAPAAAQSDHFDIRDFQFDHSLRTLSQKSTKEIIKLSPKEADLLRHFCLNQNNLVARNDILNLLWGDDNYFNGRSMDVFVSKLRKHFREDPHIQIENIHGRGFRFLVNE